MVQLGEQQPQQPLSFAFFFLCAYTSSALVLAAFYKNRSLRDDNNDMNYHQTSSLVMPTESDL
jgi:hypothetical protein